MVHDNENVVLSLKIDEKIWPTQKSSDQHSKKKLVERKRKLISVWLTSQEVVVLAYGNVRISSRGKILCEDFHKQKTWLVTV